MFHFVWHIYVKTVIGQSRRRMSEINVEYWECQGPTDWKFVIFLKLSSKQGVCSNICCIIYFRCERISPMNYLSSSMCESSILFFFLVVVLKVKYLLPVTRRIISGGKWNLGRFNKIRKCEKWKLFLLAWLLHLSLLRVWYHSLVMEQFKRYIWEQETLSCFLPN